MVEEVKKEEIDPPNAPWKLGWNEVAKASGADVPEPTTTQKVVKAVSDKVKPWLMEWGVIAKESETQKPAEKQKPTESSKKHFDLKEYLSKLSSTESNDNPKAKAKTSSATGLHQFTSGTWMEMVNKLDLPYTLADRTNPEKSTKVVEEFTKKNLEKAQKDLGRSPTMTEAYLYHFVGRSAPKLILAPPEAIAIEFVTATQAKANKSVFYNKDGTPKTVREVKSKYEERFK